MMMAKKIFWKSGGADRGAMSTGCEGEDEERMRSGS